ncbi:hypothetical protein OF83DRAFT_1170396 [Amylostereum chailletii]|nr:hypothetical protein OF83DRAFT_1170396 [Amylostereum chailletii]
MAAARYTPLSNSRFPDDAQHELDDAFGTADATEYEETVPLTIRSQSPSNEAPSAIGMTCAYDFERDYDHPPPGSPPLPSSIALPNVYGNSNGLLPSSPISRSFPRPSILRRAFRTFLPSPYQPLQTQSEVPGRGGGIQNDGVFANVMAKPVASAPIRTADGNIFMTPEVVQAEAPPSYAAASADAAPSYWETTIHVPSALTSSGDMIVDELPTGPVLTFILTTLVSWFLQFPGFILCYLLSSTHAGRFGSQAGLALTLIQFGLGTTISGPSGFPASDDKGSGEGDHPSEGVPSPPGNADMEPPNDYDRAGSEWVSFLLMTIGWFLLLTSIIGYLRVKRFEMSIRASNSQNPVPMTLEDRAREEALQRRIEEVFGITVIYANNDARPSQAIPHSEGPPTAAEEARLEHALRQSGFL